MKISLFVTLTCAVLVLLLAAGCTQQAVQPTPTFTPATDNCYDPDSDCGNHPPSHNHGPPADNDPDPQFLL